MPWQRAQRHRGLAMHHDSQARGMSSARAQHPCACSMCKCVRCLRDTRAVGAAWRTPRSGACPLAAEGKVRSIMRLNVEHRIDNDCSRTGARKQRKQDRLRETTVAPDTHTRAMDSPALEVDPARGGGDIIGACQQGHGLRGTAARYRPLCLMIRRPEACPALVLSTPLRVQRVSAYGASGICEQ